jgi:4-hydroxy 2-oxovalerate aldolase
MAVYDACVAAGIDYMEVGYKASKKLFARDKCGAWKFCDEDDIRRIVGDNPTPLKLSAMADAAKADWHTDIRPKKDSVLEAIAKSAARSIGSSIGRQVVRGILGSILKGR